MADAVEELKRQTKALASAPIILCAVVLLLAGLIWSLVHWSYRTVLAGKNAYVASLEGRLADYESSVNGASPAEARRRIDAMENELTALRIRLTPRRLTSAQRQALSDRSRRPSGVPSRNLSVIVEESCGDCAAFAADISDALRAVDNWIVASHSVSRLSDRSRSGLAIRLVDPTRPSQEAVVIQEALRSAGLAFSVIPAASVSGVELLVTERVQQ